MIRHYQNCLWHDTITSRKEKIIKERMFSAFVIKKIHNQINEIEGDKK